MSLRPVRAFFFAVLTFALPLCPSLAGWTHLGAVAGHAADAHGVTLTCETAPAGPTHALVRVEAVTDHIVRVRLAPDGRFDRDFSWAVLDATPRGSFTSAGEDQADLVFSTGPISIAVQQDPFRITFRDENGNVLAAEAPEYGMGWQSAERDSGRAVRAWHVLPPETSVFGLGEKAGVLNKSSQAWEMWNTDAYGYRATTDPLYLSVPFFMIAHEGNRFTGIFLDNPWRTSFDFGKLDRDELSFGADGGELDYYVIAGPSPKDVVRRFTKLVGRMELPPKWAIGYHQCRYSYYPESRVREIATGFRERNIPCDVIWFDIDYMDGYRCFTWDDEHFPDPHALIADLNGMGFHTIAIIDPGIKAEPGYFVYDQGTERQAWVTKPDGQPYVGRVWPGDCVYPDFTDPAVRDWWAGLFPPFLEGCGLDGVWNDMNEPANFAEPSGTLPLDVVHDNEGKPATHRACHNIYGMQMARATLEGIRRTRPEQRPFTLTRASFAGGQRYGAAWTGDNISSWDHLAMSIPMVLNLGLSGMPFVGPDIGGFVGGPTPELYARWIQVGALYPFARTHTGKGNPDQEPWSYGPRVERIARASLERRYAWLPYLYTLFEEAARTGVPIMRPVWMEFPGFGGRSAEGKFMLGPDIFVAPTLHPGEEDVIMRLPPGVWYDGNNGLVYGGDSYIRVSGKLEVLPHFFRAGAIVPMQSVVQHTAQQPEEPFIVHVWPAGHSESTLYEDDGSTLEHRNGVYRRTSFRCDAKDESVTFSILEVEGSYQPPGRTPLVHFHGLGGTVASVTCISRADESGEQGEATAQTQTATQFQSRDKADLEQPADFHFDADTRSCIVRMHPDRGQPQMVTITLKPREHRESKPIEFTFDEPVEGLSRHRFAEPEYHDGVLTLTVRSEDPYLFLPRLRIPAEALPVMRLRIATEQADRLEVKFATEQQPTLLNDSTMTFELTADGRFHDYEFDLVKASEGKWRGMVFRVDLRFKGNLEIGETIRMDRIAFEQEARGRRSPSSTGAD